MNVAQRKPLIVIVFSNILLSIIRIFTRIDSFAINYFDCSFYGRHNSADEYLNKKTSKKYRIFMESESEFMDAEMYAE